MKKLKVSFPEIGRVMFGAYEGPKYLLDWIKYVKNATQEETIDIYNNISVFLCSSINERYGLTGLESMACGCVLCSTDYAAVHEYAEDGRNCLLSTVGNVDAQTEKWYGFIMGSTQQNMSMKRLIRAKIFHFWFWEIKHVGVKSGSL